MVPMAVYAHARYRAYDRYGVMITMRDFEYMHYMIENNIDCIHLRDDIYRMHYKFGKIMEVLYPVYNKETHLILTFKPRSDKKIAFSKNDRAPRDW
jgi:nucleoside-triphosphatase THEP1